jgi:hypothetical protein
VAGAQLKKVPRVYNGRRRWPTRRRLSVPPTGWPWQAGLQGSPCPLRPSDNALTTRDPSPRTPPLLSLKWGPQGVATPSFRSSPSRALRIALPVLRSPRISCTGLLSEELLFLQLAIQLPCITTLRRRRLVSKQLLRFCGALSFGE